MEMMFAGCHRLNQNLNHFDVSNVENMRFIFSCCFDFKHKLNWDIKETCDTESAFDEDVLENSKEQKNLITPKTKAELKTLVNDNAVDLAQIDISLIDDLSSLFENSERKDFSGIESWDVSHVKSIKAMFQNAKNFNVNLNRWDVGNVEDFSYVFCGCWNLDCYMSNWNTKNSKAEKMYHNCPNVYINRISINYIEKTKKYLPKDLAELSFLVSDESIHLGDIDTSLITDMSWLFSSSKRKDFSGISNWDTSKVTNMSLMFRNCRYFNEDISSWDTSNVRNMSSMFEYCFRFNQPIGRWDVSNVENMFQMFSWCISFNQPLICWNVSNVEIMAHMFDNCARFNQPLENWNVGNVRRMDAMFINCVNFNQPLNKWNASKVQNMNDMFKCCIKFNQNLNSWYVPQSCVAEGMFSWAGISAEDAFKSPSEL